MRDKSKKLTVVNTGKRPTPESAVTKEAVLVKGAGLPVNMSDYLLKAIWEKVFEVRTTEDGVEYLFCKVNWVSQYGITSYAEGDDLDLPSIYDGLPIDNQTLYWEETDGVKVLKAKGGGSGEGSFEEIATEGEGNAITRVDVVKGDEEKPDKLVFTKEKTFIDKELLEKDYLTKAFIEENYYTKTKSDEIFFKKDDAKGLYVTLDETTQEILGIKTFKNGLNIGTSKIWQSQDDVVYIDANLVVRGGVMMYGVNQVDVPTIMAGVAVDGVTISKANGYLEVIGGGGGSIKYPLTWSGYASGSWDGSSAKNIYIPSKVSELSNDSAFITSSALGNYLPLTGGIITGNLTVNDTVYCDVYRSKNGRWLFGCGETAISFGGYYAGVPTTFNGETLQFLACSEEKLVIDRNGASFKKSLWCDERVNALYFTSLTASATSSNTSGGFRMGKFDESDGGFKMQFGGTGTTGTLQVIDQQWTKSLFKLDKSGNLLVSGGITMYSDERKKKILNHVQLSLREVADAPLIEHYYNSDEKKTTHVGSIAQYWAGLNDWFCKVDADGFYTMEVQNAALASAISVARELLKYETKTDKQIRKLKKRISELEEEVELLKKM